MALFGGGGFAGRVQAPGLKVPLRGRRCTAGLRGVHQLIRGPKRLFGTTACTQSGDAHRELQSGITSFRGQEPPPQGGHAGLGQVALQARCHHQKLVAAESTESIVGPETLTQGLGEMLEAAIPGLVPEFVIDTLKVVEVEEKEGGAFGLRRAQDPRKSAPVRQCGQRVVIDETAQTLLRIVQLADRRPEFTLRAQGNGEDETEGEKPLRSAVERGMNREERPDLGPQAGEEIQSGAICAA